MEPLRKRALKPGQRIRVLVVDDSAVIRRLVVRALEEDPLIEIAGNAPNGAIALERIRRVNPDVVILDIEMPEVDGLEMLRRLRMEHSALRVVMFSSLTERGASGALEALALGADDYVLKTSQSGPLDVSLDRLRQELIPKIKQFFSTGEQAGDTVPSYVKPGSSTTGGDWKPGSRAEAVAIGVSTGGPAALAIIVPQFPADFALPILIVQHMPPLFTRLLAERLGPAAKLRVTEAVQQEVVEPGHIYIAPGDHHMRVHRIESGVEILLGQDAPQNSCRPAVDALFTSVAEVYGGAALAAVLTGMGRDGLCGARQLKARGAPVLAQDEASSVVWGMPGAVARAGLADEILPLESIVPSILRRVGI